MVIITLKKLGYILIEMDGFSPARIMTCYICILLQTVYQTNSEDETVQGFI
jgi:hypothetical protein